eukprot:TRINITY_DN1588_c0_g2_i1.p1 TRINITY_DN1588_c0_g2~~TRINITY_DN1588_c0_g2_i1.p1  ORF type:complete len:395 (-),score=86.57 TRINITY_DN1588_c0_g2_i1:152-1336(-)
MKLSVVLLVLFVGICFSQDEPAIITGHVGQSLEFAQPKGITIDGLKNKLPRSFTFECWFFHVEGLGVQPIVSRLKKLDIKEDNKFFDFFLFIKENKELIFFMGNGQAYAVFGSGYTFTKNQWHHVGFTVNHHVEGNTTNQIEATLYLDAKPIAPYAPVNGGARQVADDAPVLIGFAKNQDAGVHFFTGFMDEIRFWSEPLKAEDILKFSKQPLSGFEPTLLLYYNMDHEKGDQINTLVDKTISGLHTPLPAEIKKVWKNPPFPIVLSAPYNALFYELVLPGDSIHGPHAFNYVLTKLSPNATFYFSPQESCAINASLVSRNQSFHLPSNILYFSSPFKSFPEKAPVISFSFYGVAPLQPVIPGFASATSVDSDVVVELTKEERVCSLCVMCGVF